MAYTKAIKYYNDSPKNRSGLIVLPTGTGKTGLISLLPFALCKKRTLIIAPNTTIRDGILDEMDGYNNPRNFWNDKGVLETGDFLPQVVEYEKDTLKSVLESSNIVVLNIEKTMTHLDSSILKAVDPDFFDLVIIDEAHHAPAESWVNCIEYFKNAKIINLTGTPFRTDNQQINAELIYQYKLSRAMANGYVKSLENIVFTPDELRLTIDGDAQEYTVEEIYETGIKDSEWVSRSVALSKSCSESIVNKSIELLEEKKSRSSTPHKIIAVACSVAHAMQIQSIYEEKGVKASVIYHDSSDRQAIFNDIKNHRIDVIINIAMLGEGYDHPYLSIAAIFRPFRTDLPYAQFIGRVLRRIHDAQAESDNIAQIIAHKHLYLENLWLEYKKEIDEANIILELNKIQEEISDILDNDNIIPFPTQSTIRALDLGSATDSEKSSITRDSYLDTELIKQHEAEKLKEQEQIDSIMATLNVSDMEAREIINRSRGKASNLNRPDLIIKQNKKDIYVEITEIIVPALLEDNCIPAKEKTLSRQLDVFTSGRYSYIGRNTQHDNAAMLAIYLNTYLRNHLGKARKEWTEADFKIAWEELDKMKNFLNKKIKILNK